MSERLEAVRREIDGALTASRTVNPTERAAAWRKLLTIESELHPVMGACLHKLGLSIQDDARWVESALALSDPDDAEFLEMHVILMARSRCILMRDNPTQLRERAPRR